MAGRRKNPRMTWLLALAAAVLAIAAIYFYIQYAQARDAYAREAAITPVPTIAPPTIFANPTPALLRTGSVGPEVKKLQNRLKELGFYTGGVDGQFGSGTKAAVELFQAQHSLKADGLAGEDTLAVLYGPAAHQLTVTPAPSLPPQSRQDVPLLVNRTNPLAEGAQPRDLVLLRESLPNGLAILKDPDVRAALAAVRALGEMLQAAQAQGLGEWQVSEGYRTLARQQQLFDAQFKQYQKDGMSDEAAQAATLKTVAKPGTSEHHTGLAFDITVPGKYFIDTPQATWLAKHCHAFGFILRYTPDKEEITGFLAEPWHIRYVGKLHSQFMYDANLSLEEYIDLLKKAS